ncbi:unnamed protein product [Camellia sinensis]
MGDDLSASHISLSNGDGEAGLAYGQLSCVLASHGQLMQHMEDHPSHGVMIFHILEVARGSYSLASFKSIVMGFSTRDRRLIHGGVSGFASGASESCGMGYSSPCSHLHLH